MAEAQVLEPEEEGLVALEEKHLQDTGETCVRVFYTTKGGGRPEDESDPAVRPLLGHKHQPSPGESHRETDGGETSVQHELLSAGRGQVGGSVSSLCSGSSRHECPICSEPFSARGERRAALLLCDHALCHRCVSGIMSRAKDPGRLRCPFCRQTTPFPQWEIRRLQEESYSSSGGGAFEPGPALAAAGPGPELQAVPLCCAPLERLLEVQAGGDGCCSRLHCACLSITVLLLVLSAAAGLLPLHGYRALQAHSCALPSLISAFMSHYDRAHCERANVFIFHMITFHSIIIIIIIITSKQESKQASKQQHANAQKTLSEEPMRRERAAAPRRACTAVSTKDSSRSARSDQPQRRIGAISPHGAHGAAAADSDTHPGERKPPGSPDYGLTLSSEACGSFEQFCRGEQKKGGGQCGLEAPWLTACP
ncbi:hypothetical protein L3Q82_012374 [Scortum barcoo]|uniref:Uncharacterized protein n=1 Tax=Scortum barcoo TaxID=214431 RepID=A0ACB8W5H6_9TELE|nr:hypothetical protein L3Q82_012374 [Scortum barcoo]